MFFSTELEKELSIQPKDLGPSLRHRIRERLAAEVEGKSLGRYGYIIKVENIPDSAISKGRLEDATGEVQYKIKFVAIVFRPFKEEVIDAVVGVCNELGFFCHAGPLEIFVSHRTMPEDMQNYNHETSRWVDDEKKMEIAAGSGVRVRIMNLRIDANKIFAVGTIKDNYLGLIEFEFPEET
uniref:RNA polymerase Rpb7-like N-terminal domain-containing protein n=1 Tax=Aplanochytrium stocchinoi TaxID=215587 RepID=A0A7S3UZC8_9STRA|mmetsp:Transcript_1036/g.1313  ORF Transcript_1036/g.1313 Transcript_1036/m.1313 type:complete len:181 (+) Transcript_1036:216-758(+)|eukprot:CAMPEP_0204824408 /NCGR_PEP_ID=MMETSP1346-20131115/2440_1 /ASSEMBLY_ACC=CAM_ASM_000771 /TAXON_ID=215587 /ORGANISM="Aplanochytrium stocchinoi, Strain GSBS06" /LENGTH=180 /DNA_ID=CAMNT_0051951553 /DNA_START=155 /DNA_END=697 /DNA_ORIENTATION=-